MRFFVFLLVLANLLFFAWTEGYLGTTASGSPSLPLQTEQLILVSRGTPPEAVPAVPEPKASPSTKPAATTSCLLLNELSDADASLLESLLAEQFPAFTSTRRAPPDESKYWVLIPPLANQQDIDRKIAELKRRNVTDFSVLREGPNQRAISLGVFSTENAAKNHLESLREQGVKSAKVAERVARETISSLEITGPEAEAESLRKALADVLPARPPVACMATNP